MRSISKGSEPPVLADARRTATLDGRHITGDDWPPAGPGGTQDIRDALYAEQAGLCAYCCSRIRANQGADGVQIPPGNRAVPGAGGMCIEHWMPRHGYPDSDESEREACGRETLSWENLLGVCVGVSIGPDQESQSESVTLRPCPWQRAFGDPPGQDSAAFEAIRIQQSEWSNDTDEGGRHSGRGRHRDTQPQCGTSLCEPTRGYPKTPTEAAPR